MWPQPYRGLTGYCCGPVKRASSRHVDPEPGAGNETKGIKKSLEKAANARLANIQSKAEKEKRDSEPVPASSSIREKGCASTFQTLYPFSNPAPTISSMRNKYHSSTRQQSPLVSCHMTPPPHLYKYRIYSRRSLPASRQREAPR